MRVEIVEQMLSLTAPANHEPGERERERERERVRERERERKKIYRQTDCVDIRLQVE